MHVCMRAFVWIPHKGQRINNGILDVKYKRRINAGVSACSTWMCKVWICIWMGCHFFAQPIGLEDSYMKMGLETLRKNEESCEGCGTCFQTLFWKAWQKSWKLLRQHAKFDIEKILLETSWRTCQVNNKKKYTHMFWRTCKVTVEKNHSLLLKHTKNTVLGHPRSFIASALRVIMDTSNTSPYLPGALGHHEEN